MDLDLFRQHAADSIKVIWANPQGGQSEQIGQPPPALLFFRKSG
jgi:hypothetical protein